MSINDENLKLDYILSSINLLASSKSTSKEIKILIRNGNPTDNNIIKLKEVYQNLKISRDNYENAKLNELKVAKEVLPDIFDFNKFKASLENRSLDIDIFLKKLIFPPFFYLCDNKNKLINSKDLKLYYLKRMELWKLRENDEIIRKLIMEINFSYENNLNIITTFGMFTLLEYKMRRLIPESKHNKYYSYTELIDLLDKAVFSNMEDSESKKYFSKYLEELFADTKNTEKLTRHIIHGVKINLITSDGLDGLIYFYDFISQILMVKKKFDEL
ncbi:hypothetical protein [uncultured Clostridium sp.]|uniref:hypothetical protein n=1 Tax=uncultured Clostridium sp. TaxID=59620 RepID=UPI00260C94DF|nr:hypothetical protein [uncultured Clostridium sp.]